MGTRDYGSSGRVASGRSARPLRLRSCAGSRTAADLIAVEGLLQFRPHPRVALTRGALQPVAIEDGDAPSREPDESRRLQRPTGDVHGGTGDAEHVAEELLRQPDLVAFH